MPSLIVCLLEAAGGALHGLKTSRRFPLRDGGLRISLWSIGRMLSRAEGGMTLQQELKR